MIGLDAIALTRGHRDVVVLVTVPLEGGGVEILAVPADREKETVAACPRTIPAPLRHTLERACTDMSEDFVRASAEEVPWAEIVIDRCDAARASRDCAARVRTQARKRLTAEYAEITGALWPFRNRPVDRKPSAWVLRERVCTDSPKMEAAYHLREDLTELCERDYAKAGATRAMRAWCLRARASGLTEFESGLGRSSGGSLRSRTMSRVGRPASLWRSSTIA